MPKLSLTAWTKQSIKDYHVADPVMRIKHAYRISKQADAFASQRNVGDTKVMTALAKITGDRPAARKLRRLHAVPERMIEKACERVAAANAETENRRNQSIGGASRKRRLPDADRITRTAGISLTHLLTLAGVQDRRKRDQLFRDSIQQGWSSAELKRQARGSSEKQRPTRPVELTYATVVKANELIEVLNRVAAPEVLEAARNVKSTELSRSIQQCTDAIRKLKMLERRIGPTIDNLSEARELLKQRSS